MKELPTNVSQSFKARNPHLYPVAGLQSQKSKSTAAQALGRFTQEHQERQRSLEAVVTIIPCRRRLLDDDNNVGSCKAVRDAIAESMGIDDSVKWVRWEYGQLETKGREGVIVKIEVNDKGQP